MNVLRRDFLKYCIGSAAALGLDFSTLGPLGKKLLAGDGAPSIPTYPIGSPVTTTIQRTLVPTAPPLLRAGKRLLPSQVSLFSTYGYGKWTVDPQGFPFKCPDMQNPPNFGTANSPSQCTTLLNFFAMSDIHISDKESPVRCPYYGYQYPEPYTTKEKPPQPQGNSSAYSAIILYTTQVLDAAVQTINVLHQTEPFDFGIALGDMADNTQYNELRWFINVLDGQWIIPSSGANLGVSPNDPNGPIDYQQPYQAAGLASSIPWYAAVGNHDQFWMGSCLTSIANGKPLNAYTGTGVLNIGQVTSVKPIVNWSSVMNSTGVYMGVVDGTTKYGDIIYAGPVNKFKPAPAVAADSHRYSLSISNWMNEFFTTTSSPAGHGFTEAMIEGSTPAACYSFYPNEDMPIKVIVLDDTDKAGSAFGALDYTRYYWLLNELQEGQANDELMIVCAHIPVNPYAQEPAPPNNKPCSYLPIWAPYAEVTQEMLLGTLWTYPNLVLWISGHVHRNTITAQPSSPYSENPDYGFWTVETPSLRDFPRGIRRFNITKNPQGNISIFVYTVDPAANTAPLPDGLASPALTSLSYAIAAQYIFGNPWQQGPGMDPHSCIYNAELVIQAGQLSSGLQTWINSI